jgi:hypothetical protein
MLNRKPPMLMIVALANKMTRIAWALMTRGETYRVRRWRDSSVAGLKMAGLADAAMLD